MYTKSHRDIHFPELKGPLGPDAARPFGPDVTLPTTPTTITAYVREPQTSSGSPPSAGETSSQSRGLEMSSDTKDSSSRSVLSPHPGTPAAPADSEGGEEIIGYETVTTTKMVPRHVLEEEIVTKTVTVPEKVIREVSVEDSAVIREKIVEVEKIIAREKVVEVPEIEYVETVVEVPIINEIEKIVEVPKTVFQQKLVHVPKKEKVRTTVEIPEIEYVEVPVEKIVEVQQIREEVRVKEVPVPQYVDRPVAETVTIEEEKEVHRRLPLPVECVTTYELKLPRLRPQYDVVDIPLHVPRFVEVPFPMDMMDATTAQQAEHFASQVGGLVSGQTAGLCEVENLAGTIKATDFVNLLHRTDAATTVLGAWETGALQVDPESWRRVQQGGVSPPAEGFPTLLPPSRVVTTAGYSVGGSAPVPVPVLTPMAVVPSLSASFSPRPVS